MMTPLPIPSPAAVERIPSQDGTEFPLPLLPSHPAKTLTLPPTRLKLDTMGLTRHARQVKFEFDRNLVKLQIVARLDQAGRPDLADPIRECHEHWMVRQCTGCRKSNRFWNRCDKFYCPNCQPKLARTRAEGIQWWASTIRQPKHVILTVRNVPVLTVGYVRRIKKAFNQLRKTKFAKAWVGGCYSIEVTNEGNGWHVHLHILVDCRWVDGEQLALEWAKRVKQDFAIVKVKDCRGGDYVREVTKYAVKGTDLAKWAGEQAIEYILAMTGVRCFGTFGTLYRRNSEFAGWLEELARKKRLCECGCETFKFYNPDEWEAHELEFGHAPPRTKEAEPQLPVIRELFDLPVAFEFPR